MRIDFGGGGGVGGPSKSIYNETSFVRNNTIKNNNNYKKNATICGDRFETRV